MKLSKLFVLGVFGLMSLSANALGFGDLIEREAPEEPDWTVFLDELDKTPQTFELGKVYVIYNVSAEMYFTRGNAWGTQSTASADEAMPVRFILPEGKTLADKALYMRDYVSREDNMRWRTAFITTSDGNVNGVYGDGTPALFVDNNDGEAALLWVESAGDKVYHLSISELNSAAKPEGTFFGIDPEGPGVSGGEDGTVINPKTNLNIDWQFFAVPEMTAYFEEYDVFEKSEELKTMIEKAEEAGVDVTDAVNTYNNDDSTIEQMNAAIIALKEDIAAQSDITGSADNPGDATALIENPDFDSDEDGNGDNTGWSGTAPNMVGSGSHGPACVAEVWNNTFDTYQDIMGMPAGVYGLSAYTCFRGSWNDLQAGLEPAAKLYATADGVTTQHPFANMYSILNTVSMSGPTEFGTNAGEQSHTEGDVTYYIPNDPSAARLYFEKGFYYNTLVFDATTGSARIGVKNPAKNGDADNWSVFDTFRLTYYGNEGAASYKSWLNDNASKLYATEAMATPSLVDAYKNFVAGLEAPDAASANAALETAKNSDELTALNANISLWGQWLAALNAAEEYTTGDYGNTSAAGVLGEYISFDAEEQKNDPTWTDEQIKAEIEKIAEMIKAIKDELNSMVQPGTDVTDLYIGNDDAKFNNGRGGWTVEGDGVNVGAGCLEAYNQEFDLFKIVDGPQVGVYELELQGFFRLERDQTAFDMYGRGEQDKTRAWIYLNDVKSYVKCVFDEQIPGGAYEDGSQGSDGQYWVDGNTDNWYPNTMTSANEAFEAGLYKTRAYGLVATSGEQLRLGVAGNMKGNNWIIWDNFKLTYLGFEAATIKPILEEALNNFTSLDQPMGKDVYAKAQSVKKTAEEALNSNDGKTMFDALTAIWAIDAEISASVALFNKLKTANEGLNELISSSSNEEAVAKAGEFYETVSANIQQNAYNDDEVEGLLKEIKGLRYMLRMPAEIVAGTDLTEVLECPEYSDDEGAATSEGWEGTTAGTNSEYMNAEIFNTESFDHYQEIPGLPEGTYEVTVKAFYRAGTAVEDYAALQESKPGCDNAVLYANTWSQQLHRLAEFAEDTHAGEADWAEVAENSGLYVPNMMSTAATLFDEKGDDVVNTVKAFIKEGETLRLGLKKEVGIANDWCLFDDWKLKYVSKENTAGEVAGKKGDVNGDGAVNVADISAIIDIMAAGKVEAAADINGDGAVNVADISAVIDIMAALARAAKAIEE